ncbi:hypothetical protein BZK31_05175 [Pseudomonas floridensis]|uniref:Flavin reductase like domain-containing protein n=1 Tax=Pseudomonas floridensis TaxID=1958950 RepID=A0A1X0N9W1_9PSED|nr:flavin reductase family protein [Pseudomonas floridensis]ORC60832.1 hypothetical protein BZK31_05175 [Pseudomonas floridensis]
MIDATEYENVMGSFPSGVIVITTLNEDGEVVGLTASAFSSLSVDPPLVLFCPNYSSMVGPIKNLIQPQQPVDPTVYSRGGMSALPVLA